MGRDRLLDIHPPTRSTCSTMPPRSWKRLARAAAEHAVRNDRHATLGIPDAVWPMVVRSWERAEPSLYGRMDLRWDGTGPPKLLEYNADTPTALYEAAVIQWEWLSCAFPEADQFNSIHERLIETWKTLRAPLGTPALVHFARRPRQRRGPRHHRLPARHGAAGRFSWPPRSPCPTSAGTDGASSTSTVTTCRW